MKKSFSRYYHFLYVLADIVVAFAISVISFFALSGISGFDSINITSALVYSASNAALIVLSFFIFGVYKMLTSEFGLFEAIKILIITVFIQIIGLLVVVFVNSLPRIEDYVFAWILATISLAFLLPSIRIFVRTIILIRKMHLRTNLVRTLVVGAGSAAKVFIDDSRKNTDAHSRVVALIDDDKNKIGSSFSGMPVFGPISNIMEIIEKYKIQEVVIAIANLTKERVHDIVTLIGESQVRIKRMPLLTEMQGPNDMKVVNVDLDELLCRPAIKLDNIEVNSMLQGKTVLVTGAGGSIGSELVRQIFRTHPKTLVLFDIYENSTYDIQQELKRIMRDNNVIDTQLVTLIGSTYNVSRIEHIISKYKPDYIYHAAAYKHVPLMEDSPVEAIRTNVIGTYNVARLADKYKVKKMVLVSTDKAVRPTNVMGATKRFAETIIQYFAEKSLCTAYAAVRFGNVLGSNGSVVPLFTKQIEAGGPITITHKDIIRYFMTIPEAVSLILQCGLYATGGEIFILDMGKPVRILDLAEKLIRQAGLVPYVDVDIIETGLRPGEKLYEELLIDKSSQTKTQNEKIFVEQKDTVWPIEEEIKKISTVFEMDENADVKKMLASIITSYTVDKRD